ncbi:MAG TPA: transcriptional repressor LexA [Gammaproteobacteria bacterium]|nr:transcriptional repressor LexA [Gammaproteobacteria bacterium]
MISDSQRKTLEFIRQYVAENGYAPKLHEIADGIGIKSRGVVHRYVQALTDQGYLAHEPGKHRGLHLAQAEFGSEETTSAFSLPLLGTIAAGMPIQAIPGQDEISLAEFFLGPGRFALKVQGSSMIEAGILDGDVAVIKQQNTARSGEIVVALIDNDEATLKTIKYQDGLVQLIPANHSMQPMVFEPQRVQIQGVLVGSFRRY